jgi:hypothetical protein
MGSRDTVPAANDPTTGSSSRPGASSAKAALRDMMAISSHPAIRDLLQARALAARKLRMLGLDLEAARLACSVPEPTSGFQGRLRPPRGW